MNKNHTKTTPPIPITVPNPCLALSALCTRAFVGQKATIVRSAKIVNDTVDTSVRD